MSASEIKRALSVFGRLFALDVMVFVMWRFVGQRSWSSTLTVTGFFFVLAVAMAAYTVWWERNPAFRQRAEARYAAKQARRRPGGGDE
ncbi:hypothetical protein [Streptacidiphilus monticola]|uniref:DUF4229 domain-containing protein n=1 Tax=Streptacidiphilus monticola TaxID=2161674 RepID=A0ABW1G845_9ACTN